MEILRNLYRRRLRTGLTVLGIAVGVLAFTIMGGMAEKLNSVIRGGQAYFTHRVAVRSNGGLMRLNLLMPEDITALRRVDGVREVETHVMLPLDETIGLELTPRFLIGVELENFLHAQRLADAEAKLRLWKGRWWRKGEQRVAVVGTAVARKMGLRVGSQMVVRGAPFRVVGLLHETLSVPDGWVLVPQADARALMLAGSDLLRGLALEGFVTNAYAIVRPEQGEAVTRAIAEHVRRGFLLHSPQQVARAAGTASALLNTTILGSAAAAVVVGALSVVNTMFITVSERTREIGIKRAIGAARSDIVREFLLESTVIGLLGGIVGVLFGAIVIMVLNGYTDQQGSAVFLLTPRLAVGAIGCAAFLGTISGLLPALRASGLDPVEALREV